MSTSSLSDGRIDTHHHVMHELWMMAEAEHSPGQGFQAPQWSVDSALSLMDATHVRASILSVSAPGVHFGDDAAARDLARRVNQASAEIVKDRPDRFGFFASLPVPDVDGALEETRVAFDELDADGVILLASTAGQYVGDPALDPLMAELDRRHATVFIHPGALPGPAVPGIPPFLADFLLDTVRAAISMVLHDIPQRFPNLNIILSHGGGFLPYIPARLDHTMGVMGVTPERMQQFRSFWFDTALTPSPSSLPSLLAFADPGRITYGSDFPYATNQTATSFAQALDGHHFGDGGEQLAAINHGNAQRLFPRFA